MVQVIKWPHLDYSVGEGEREHHCGGHQSRQQLVAPLVGELGVLRSGVRGLAAAAAARTTLLLSSFVLWGRTTALRYLVRVQL